MKGVFARFLERVYSQERGQTSLEYALIIATGVVLAGVLAYTVKQLLRTAPKEPIETGATRISEQLR